MTAKPSVLLLVPHFGGWPPWIQFFLNTCRWNAHIDWLFLSDAGVPGQLSPNLHFHALTLDQFSAMAQRRLNCELRLLTAYKVCDFRLAFGLIFDEMLAGYDYFGWSDIDVVYGDLGRFLTPAVMDHDVITFNERHLSGHLTLIRNTAPARRLHLSLSTFMSNIANEEYQHLDEPAPASLSGFDVYARESFNTPLSRLIPWRDGTYRFPTEWQWEDGRLTNDLDEGVEFSHLHFMHWKGGPWARRCGNAQWERLDSVVHVDPAQASRGFRINATGFHELRVAARRAGAC